MRAFSEFSAIFTSDVNVLVKTGQGFATTPATDRGPAAFQLENESVNGNLSGHFRSPSLTLARMVANRPLSFKCEDESSLPHPGSTNGTVSPPAPTATKRWDVAHAIVPHPGSGLGMREWLSY